MVLFECLSRKEKGRKQPKPHKPGPVISLPSSLFPRAPLLSPARATPGPTPLLSLSPTRPPSPLSLTGRPHLQRPVFPLLSSFPVAHRPSEIPGEPLPWARTPRQRRRPTRREPPRPRTLDLVAASAGDPQLRRPLLRRVSLSASPSGRCSGAPPTPTTPALASPHHWETSRA
jgi:hypothetical protein